MTEIEWLDKVQKNFIFKEQTQTMNEYFRELYTNVDLTAWAGTQVSAQAGGITYQAINNAPAQAGAYYPIPIEVTAVTNTLVAEGTYVHMNPDGTYTVVNR